MASPYVATKVTQKAVSRGARLPHMAFAPQIRQNNGLLNLTAISFAHYPTLQIRFANATAQASIVLPAFARSCSVDGKINNSIIKPR